MSNILGQTFAQVCKSSYLDSKTILWKWIDDKWIGKRSVYTFDLAAKWIEDTSEENIKKYWCGIDADYTEIFTKENIK